MPVTPPVLVPPELVVPPVLFVPPVLVTPPVLFVPPVLLAPPVPVAPPVLFVPPVLLTPPVLLVPPVLVVQVAIGTAPRDLTKAAPIYKRLLELNASALLHSAFGLEGDQIVLAAALELEHLDLNELEAVLADIDVALGEHVPSLRNLVESAS